MRIYRLVALILLGFFTFIPGSFAEDIPGGKDHPSLKRFAGSALIGYETRNFDAVEFQTSTFKDYDIKADKRIYAQPPLLLEGKLTRLWYEAPGQTRALEIYRNYVNEITSAGFKPLYDSTTDQAAKNWPNFLASFSKHNRDFIKNKRSEFVMTAAKGRSILTGTFQKDATTVRLIAVDWPKDEPAYKAKEGAYIAVDILETKPMQQNMLTVSAAEISSSLTANGKIAIYGILFDSGKTDIKPESKPSLEQIAAFLKTEPSVKLHVVGHTDSVGSVENNLALSKRRAEAVASALNKDYGIEATRMTGNGVASLAPVANNSSEEGRAKNRRVELVLQ